MQNWITLTHLWQLIKLAEQRLEKWFKDGLEALGVNSGWTGMVFV